VIHEKFFCDPKTEENNGTAYIKIIITKVTFLYDPLLCVISGHKSVRHSSQGFSSTL